MLTLPRKEILLTGEALGQSLYMHLEVELGRQIGIWEFGGKEVMEGKNVNEPMVRNHTGKTV